MKTLTTLNGSSPPSPSPSPSPSQPVDESWKRNEYPDTLMQYICDLLMDDDLGNTPCMLHDSLSLQATEKSLYDALTNNADDNPEHNRVNKIRSRQDDADESELLHPYENVRMYDQSGETARLKSQKKSMRAKSRQRGTEKTNTILVIIDHKSLLMDCADAASRFDTKALNRVLFRVMQHSSPRGNAMERLAHYFSTALEARLAGTGTALYSDRVILAAETLKAYKMFVTACPFRQMSNILANATIGNLITESTTALHIIDFGILYGCQWPCAIHGLSKRPGGPPKLRITGIDFPQPGFRPAGRVVDTCRRLVKYAEAFGVPFEYHAIAQKWETIGLEDLRIEKNEVVVVNSMYRLHNVTDDTETGESPRDAVLGLIKKINPDLFVHGVANGKYNSPFFATRFKEALSHFSTVFDMFEATVGRDDEDRLVFEQQFFGKEVMNVIACDGTERVERPETYKQWERRIVRAGFRQVTLDQEIVERVDKVKKGYHRDFSVEKDGKWVLVGWKGRVVQGFSCWRPAN